MLARMTNPVAGRGAIDLSQLAAPRAQSAAPGAYVVELDDASFEATIRKSVQFPVVVEFYSPRAPEQEALSRDLAALADEAAGKWLLARVNVDVARQVAAALQVQAVPTVVGLIQGQLVPLWQGTLPKADAAAYIGELLKVAAQYGVLGRVTPAASSAPSAQDVDEPVIDPKYTPAYDAMEREDYDGAVAEFAKLLEANPADTEAKIGAAQAGLFARASKLHPDAVMARLADAPDDIPTILEAADLELGTGEIEAAFARLVQAVRDTSGPERDTVRKRLLELFDTLPANDPAVLKARRDLATALF